MKKEYKIYLIFVTGLICGIISQIIETSFLTSFLIGLLGMCVSLGIYRI